MLPPCRTGARWARFEPRAPRHRTSQANWQQPLRWNCKAEAAGIRAKVFGPSLADPFDAEVSPNWREDYLRLIEATPSLDWILLTKRPLVARKFFAGRKVPDNLWPGVTAENQTMLDLRAPHLLAIDARVRVVSAEPLARGRSISRNGRRDWAGSSPAARAGRGRGRRIPTGSVRCGRSAWPPASRCSSSNGVSTARA